MKKIEELGISQWPWESHKQFVIAKDDGSVVAASNYNDARLIASAPELYEALRQCLEGYCRQNDYGGECDLYKDGDDSECRKYNCKAVKWRDALAKASGESEEEK